ncbi:MAG: hypothetical protein HZA51_08435 [Planctomycetes bacterium]|nr:hypothetical protein [Planctomycetota bacterium]
MTKTYHPIRSLVWKEWREQRWRFALSALVLTTLSASMVRAQLIPTAESVAIIFGPLGLVLCVFMSMGAVPPERASGTWHFLVTQPVPFGRLLIVKWAVGAAALLSTLILAGAAAYAAERSHGNFAWPPFPDKHVDLPILQGKTSTLVLSMVGTACAAFLTLYSFMFAAMLKARTELHAGLAGILLTIVILAWAAQYPMIGWVYHDEVATVAWFSSLINPLSPLMFQFKENRTMHALALTMTPLVWVGIPVVRWLRRMREAE